MTIQHRYHLETKSALGYSTISCLPRETRNNQVFIKSRINSTSSHTNNYNNNNINHTSNNNYTLHQSSIYADNNNCNNRNNINIKRIVFPLAQMRSLQHPPY